MGGSVKVPPPLRACGAVLVMSSERVKYFRAKAAKAEKAAHQTVDQHERRRLLESARDWTILARQAEEIDKPFPKPKA